MDFVELPDGTLINTSSILRLNPPDKGNRVDYINGWHFTLTNSDAEVLRDALKPKPKLKPQKKSEASAK